VVVAAGAACGNPIVPDLDLSTATLAYTGDQPLSVMANPDGTGDPLENTALPDGTGASAVITVVQRDGEAIPTAGSPPRTSPWSLDRLLVRVNSPDIDGDGVVDVGDVVMFAQDYFGAYAYRSDLRCDGHIDLSDVARMAAAVGATYP